MAKMNPKQAHAFLQQVAAGKGSAYPAPDLKLPGAQPTQVLPETKAANKEEGQAKKEQEEADRKAAADLAKAKQNEGTVSKSVIKPIEAGVSKLPDPGSIVFPLFTLLILLFFLVPYGGQTRAVKLWNVLTGPASVNADNFATGGSDAGGFGGGASGGF